MDAISATYEGTRSFAAQYPNLQYYPLGTTDFVVSQAGFGCYRINPHTHNHQLALRTALIHGINLIDTSTTYGDGGSEQLVGHTLSLLFSGGQLKREQLVIVSKVGYLQGSNYEESQQRKQNGEGWADLVEYAQGLEHCIHPDFIHSQLSHSMDRLKLDCLDVYLLHNPEYYLGWARKHDVPLETARKTYYARIRQAFIQLEQEVAAGRIRSYGISSNSLPTSAENPEFTSLEVIWSIAQSITPNHHFKVIQLPANILENGAFVEKNQSTGQTVIELAHALGLGVLINRPLNAVIGNTLIRLASVPDFGTATHEQVEQHIDQLAQLEAQFADEIILELQDESAELQTRLKQYVSVAKTLQNRWYTLGTFHQWQQTVSSYLLPRLDATRNFLSKSDLLSEQGIAWLDAYIKEINATFRAIGAVYAGLATERSQTLRTQINSAEPAWITKALSQTAIRALRSTQGVTSVLVGMRHPTYVADVLEELSHPLAQQMHSAAWQALASH